MTTIDLRDPAPLPTGAEHVRNLATALTGFDAAIATAHRWGRELAGVLERGGRLLAAGNGGSSAQAQHLTAELVGRFRDDRRPFSAIALCAETSSLTAIGNDYDYEQVFARQLLAHGRDGDVAVLLSTSGSSRNVLAAAEAARRIGVRTWALTGPDPNPLAGACDDALCVDAPTTATVQELHLVAVHLICAAAEVALGVCPAQVADAPEAGQPTESSESAPAVVA